MRDMPASSSNFRLGQNDCIPGAEVGVTRKGFPTATTMTSSPAIVRHQSRVQIFAAFETQYIMNRAIDTRRGQPGGKQVP